MHDEHADRLGTGAIATGEGLADGRVQRRGRARGDAGIALRPWTGIRARNRGGRGRCGPRRWLAADRQRHAATAAPPHGVSRRQRGVEGDGDGPARAVDLRDERRHDLLIIGIDAGQFVGIDLRRGAPGIEEPRAIESRLVASRHRARIGAGRRLGDDLGVRVTRQEEGEGR